MYVHVSLPFRGSLDSSSACSVQETAHSKARDCVPSGAKETALVMNHWATSDRPRSWLSRAVRSRSVLSDTLSLSSRCQYGCRRLMDFPPRPAGRGTPEALQLEPLRKRPVAVTLHRGIFGAIKIFRASDTLSPWSRRQTQYDNHRRAQTLHRLPCGPSPAHRCSAGSRAAVNTHTRLPASFTRSRLTLARHKTPRILNGSGRFWFVRASCT